MAFGKKKAAERLNEAVLQSQTSGQETSALKAEMQELRALIEALWDVVRDNAGLDDGILRKAVETVKARSTSRKTADCPQCGRSLQRGSNICIYCGANVEDQKVLF